MVTRGHVKNGVVVLDEGDSVLDIPPVSIGAVLHPLTSDDDLLEEMLEGRHL